MAISFNSDAQKILDKYKVNQSATQTSQFSPQAEAILAKYGVGGRKKTEETQNTASSVSSLLPVPDKVQEEADRRNYAAQMQQSAHVASVLPKPEEQRTQVTQNYLDTKIADIDTQIASKQNQLQSATGKEKRQLNRELNALRAQKEGYARAKAYQSIGNISGTVWNTAKGAAEEWAGGHVGKLAEFAEQTNEAARAANADTARQNRIAELQTQIGALQTRLDGMTEDDPEYYGVVADINALRSQLIDQQSGLSAMGSGAKTLSDATKLMQSGQEDIAKAKELNPVGGKIGDFAVDVGSMAVQMGLDRLASAGLGLQLPEAGNGKGIEKIGAKLIGMIPFYNRAAGGAYVQARGDGGKVGGSAAYATSVGAIEVATEMIENIAAPMGKAYGAGTFDDAIESVIGKVAKKLAKTDAGRTALVYIGKVIAGGGGEFIEEVIGNAAEWQLPRIYGGDVETASDMIAQALYEGATAAVSGAGGTVMTPGSYSDARQTAAEIRSDTAQNAQDDYYAAALKNGLFSAEAAQAQRNANEQNRLARKALAEAEGIDTNTAKRDASKIYQFSRNIQNAPATYTNGTTNYADTTYGTPERGNANIDAAVASKETNGRVSDDAVNSVINDRDAMQMLGVTLADVNGKSAAQIRDMVRERIDGLVNQQNRGILNTNENKEEMFNGGEQSIGGEGRTGSLAAAEQSAGVDEVRTEEGNVREGESNGRKNLQSDYVGGVNLGIETAVGAEEDPTKTLREETNYDSDQKAIIEYGKKRGQTVRFYRGDLWVKDKPNGTPYRVRGLIHSDGKTVWVKIDHPDYSAKQIYMHEDFHAAVKSNPKVLERGIRKLKRQYANDPAGLRNLIDRYVEKYHIDATNLSDEYILEEILADAHAGIKLDTKSRSGRAQALDEKTTAKIKKAADKAVDKRSSGNAAEARTKYSINESYKDDISEWVRNGKRNGETFILGATGDVLQGLGAIENDIYMVSDKVNSILGDHPEMTIDEIKRIPEVLDDPILVLKSKGKRKGKNSRLVIFGSIKASNGKPVLSVLDLIPTEGKLRIDDMQKVNSAYTKTGNAEDFILTSEVLHADKKRTIPLLRSIGLTITSQELLRSGSIGSINYRGGNVNISGTPMSEVIGTNQLSERSMAKAAPAVTPAQNARFQNGPQAASSKNTTRTSRESQDETSSTVWTKHSREEDSDGRNLTEKQDEYFKDSKVRDADGKLKVMYHGTNADFTVFDPKGRGGKNGTQEGYGIYFTDSISVSDAYGEKTMQGYVNITHPARSDEKTITRRDLSKLIQATAEKQADEFVANGDYKTRADAIKDTWISNYTDTYSGSITSAINDVASQILTSNENDMDVVQEIMAGMAIRNYNDAYDFYDTLKGTLGIDGFITTWENRDGGSPAEIAIAFDSNQFKNVDNENPTENEDIRYSREAWQEDIDRMVEDYGKMEPGEKPYRDVTVPNKTAEDRKVSKTVRTVLEANATPDVLVDNIEQLVAKGEFSYEVYGDEKAIKDAEKRAIGLGWDKSLELWKKSVQSGKVNKKNTTLGWTLYNNAANDGNTATAIDILNNMVEHQRSAAQALQATRILKKMNPETQLYGVARSVRNLQDEINERYGDGKSPKLEIDQGLAEHFMKAKTDDERTKALQDIYVDIGRQMPSRFIDKVNAWRYLAMLGNPRTHIRNILGNAFFAPVVEAKNLTATGIESLVSRVAKIDRTKALVSGKGGKEILSAAWNDYANISEDALGGGKYSDLANANKYIDQGKRVFGNTKSELWNRTGGAALEGARRGNSNLLEVEDQWFSQPHYAYAMAQYCKSNGITAEQIKSGKGLDKARAYAVKEAQKATYRDTNWFSQFISNIGRSRMNSNNPGAKAIGIAVEGILPFRKTPANILVRGMEYSPLGLIKSLSFDLVRVKKGTITASQAIDNISAGLTGTGLLALGIFLASQCLVRGHGGDDEKEKAFEDLTGHQNYALELPGGASITLDWMAPEALPFFIGVNLWEQTGAVGDGLTLDTVLNSVTNVTEPLLEMSCLQSLNDLFESFQYSSSTNGFGKALWSTATSYLTQFVPTIFGQIERTLQENRMTTYTSKTGAINNTEVQRIIGGISAKVPGWDYRQIEYIDAWGRTEYSGGFVKRALNNFLNPAYMSEVEVSDMENELIRLYEATGESVFPSRADKTLTVNGQNKILSETQYVEYAKQKGTMSYAVVTSLTESKAYKGMSDADKAKAVKLSYDYANQMAKSNVVGFSADSWVTDARKAYEKYHLPISTFIAARVATSGIVSLKNKNGNGISNSKGLLRMKAIYDLFPNITKQQRDFLFSSIDDIGDDIRGYTKAEVNAALSKMKRQ